MKTLKVVIMLLIVTSLNSQTLPDNSVHTQAGMVNTFTKVEPPSIFIYNQILNTTPTSTFEINYSPNFPTEFKNAFQYATNIWSYLINTQQKISINAYWVELDDKVLASTSPSSFYKISNVCYPISLAEYLQGQNLNNSLNEINVKINSKVTDWYYGTDGYTPSGKYDFVTLVLHEISHGLGFIESFSVNNGDGSWGNLQSPNNGYPTIYDKKCTEGNYYANNYYKLTNTSQYPNPSSILGNVLKSNNVFFDGFKSYYVNNSSLPKLYSPSTWEIGSSISHLDEDTYQPANSNSLLTPRQDKAEAIHSPGEIGLSMMEDLGWFVNRVITITSPGAGVVWLKGTTNKIRWTDNKNGVINIDLLRASDNAFITTIASNKQSVEGSNNEHDWYIPSSIQDGDYRIKMLSQVSGHGLSLIFKISSSQQQVAAPQFDPLGGCYSIPQTIYITCSTTGAEIRYTDDGSEPTSTSIFYNGPITINSTKTIKAIAFNSGYFPSIITSGTYIISQIGQITIGPNTSNDGRGVISYISNSQTLRTFHSSNNPYIGTGSWIGGATDQKSRAVLQWDLPNDLIPDDADIASVIFEIQASEWSSPPSVKLRSVNTQLSNADIVWSDIENGTDVSNNITINTNGYWSNSYLPGSNFINRLKQSLSANKFQLAIISEVEAQANKQLRLDLQNSRLTINFNPPNRNVTFMNNFSGNNSVGQIRVDGIWRNSPYTTTYRWGQSITIEASKDRIPHDGNNWKFRKWADRPTDPSQRNITIKDQLTYQANFEKVYNLTLRNDWEGTTGGQLNYQGSPVNSVYTAEDIFTDFPINFSAITPQTNSGITWNFYSWDDGVTSTNRNVTVTSTLEYRAKFKGHLISTTINAISPNSQRKLVHFNQLGITPQIRMVYESGGAVFGTISDDNGATWYREYLLSNSLPPQGTTYRNPTIEALPDYQTLITTFESVKLEGNQYRHEIKTDYPSPGLHTIATYSTSIDKPALPVITLSKINYPECSSTGYRIGYFYFDGTGIKYKSYFYCGYNSEVNSGSVTQTSANSLNHAVASRIIMIGYPEPDIQYNQFCIVWEERGTQNELKYAQSYSGPTTDILWDDGTIAQSVSSNEENISPTIVIDNDKNACIAWVYKNTLTSTGIIKFQKRGIDGNLLAGSEKVFTLPSGQYPSSPMLSHHRNDGNRNPNDLTLTWFMPNVGTVCAIYNGINQTWSDPFLVPNTSPSYPSTLSENKYTGTAGRSILNLTQSGSLYSIQSISVPTTAQPPSQAVLNTPPNGQQNIGLNIILRWNYTFAATTYRLQISTTSDFKYLVYDQSNITSTSYQPNGLNHSITYYWRVCASNSNGTGNWSPTWAFTTSSTKIPSEVISGWNMVSVPMIVWNYQKSLIYPTANSDAFKYQGSYIPVNNLENGVGYWLKYNTSQNIDYYGTLLNQYTIPVNAGWNMIGSISEEISTSAITANPTNIIDDKTTYYGYGNNGYVVTDKIYPGKGYWVKLKSSGGLILRVQSPPPPLPPVARAPLSVPCGPDYSPPMPYFPPNVSTNRPTNDTLYWDGLQCARWYRVQLSTSSSFSTLIVNDSVSSSIMTKPLSSLSFGTTYYWRVKSGGGNVSYPWSSPWSEVFSFTTGIPPSTPTLASPSNAATGQSLSLTMIWNAANNASTYSVQLSTNSSFTSFIVNDSTLTTTSKAVGSLSYNTTYYWRVNAKNSFSTSGWSSIWSFTTTNSLPTPTLASPSNGATGQSITPTLSWNSVPDATLYNLQVSTSSSFTSFIVNDSTLTTTSKALGSFSYNTTYYWRVKAKNSFVSSGWSSTWNFTTTNSLPSPTLTSPSNGATVQSVTPTPSWNSSSGASWYDLQVSISSSFTSNVIGYSGITQTSQQVGTLEGNTVYYWRIKAMNSGAESPWTSAWSFTTYTPPAPQAPVLSFPANGTTYEVLSMSLIWNSTTYATSYIYQVSTSSNFSTLFKYDSTTSIACVVNGLSYNSTYYWQVKAKNVSGRSGWSSAWSFSIVEPTGDPGDPCAAYRSMAVMDEFTVVDLDGNQQVLYVINKGRALEKHLDKDWEMPPEPLKGIFGARFHSGKYIEDVPPKEKSPKDIKIKVKDASYPLTLHWRLQGDNNIKYWLTKWNGNGKIQLTDGSGSYVIESRGGNGGNPSLRDKKSGDIIIEASASDPCLPVQKTHAARPSEESSAGIPLVTELNQNYPNPFNPITVINYSLAEDSRVKLVVYNVLGQEVATLVDEDQKAGYKSVMLDGTNLGTGVYFYQMKTKNYLASKKLLLIK